MTFTTYDPANISANLALSGGDLSVTNVANGAGSVHSTAFFQSTGKWYHEIHVTALNGGAEVHGIAIAAFTTGNAPGFTTDPFDSYGWHTNGNFYRNSIAVHAPGAYTTGDVVSMLFDFDAGTVIFWKNGSVVGTTYTGLAAGSWHPVSYAEVGATETWTANFGAVAFAYTPTGGYATWQAPGLPEMLASFSEMTAAAYQPYVNAAFSGMTAALSGPATMSASFLPMEFITTALVGSEPPMTAAMYATGMAGSFDAMTATSEGDQLDFMSASFDAMTATGEGQGGTAVSFVGRAAVPRVSAIMLAGEAITAALRAPVPVLVAVYQSPAIITISGSASVPRAIITVLTGNVMTAELAAIAPVLAAAGFSSGTISAVLVAPAPRLSAAMSAAVLAAFRTWVLNTRKGALTEYGPEFAFNSFAQFNGQTLACGSGGIVVLGAQGLDNATAITARFRTGQESFASSLHKRVPRIYMSGEFAGDMLFRTITEGGTRTYSLPLNGITRLQQRRIPIGKGPKSRFWQLEAENVAGADFGVNDVLVYPTKLRRRVQ